MIQPNYPTPFGLSALHSPLMGAAFNPSPVTSPDIQHPQGLLSQMGGLGGLAGLLKMFAPAARGAAGGGYLPPINFAGINSALSGLGSTGIPGVGGALNFGGLNSALASLAAFG